MFARVESLFHTYRREHLLLLFNSLCSTRRVVSVYCERTKVARHHGNWAVLRGSTLEAKFSIKWPQCSPSDALPTGGMHGAGALAEIAGALEGENVRTRPLLRIAAAAQNRTTSFFREGHSLLAVCQSTAAAGNRKLGSRLCPQTRTHARALAHATAQFCCFRLRN